MSLSRGETPFTASAPILIVPAVGFSRPAISRSAVVLPQPDGPTRMRNDRERPAGELLADVLECHLRHAQPFSPDVAIPRMK